MGVYNCHQEWSHLRVDRTLADSVDQGNSFQWSLDQLHLDSLSPLSPHESCHQIPSLKASSKFNQHPFKFKLYARIKWFDRPLKYCLRLPGERRGRCGRCRGWWRRHRTGRIGRARRFSGGRDCQSPTSPPCRSLPSSMRIACSVSAWTSCRSSTGSYMGCSRCLRSPPSLHLLAPYSWN